jgi:hypothetical protein
MTTTMTMVSAGCEIRDVCPRRGRDNLRPDGDRLTGGGGPVGGLLRGLLDDLPVHASHDRARRCPGHEGL